MKRFFVAMLSASMLISGAAFAQATKAAPDNFDWSACKAEVTKWCADAKGNEATYLCLAKHDEDLSKTCDATHNKYEEVTGRKTHANQ